ncbi:phosphatidylglycerophosphatase and protein-tyrosine phosphatase 1-like [Rhopilema esculentum]|uniref:phosphatidylglycerophosphatase and protein-tyrosine phosphatase 1-like n=1 Tax=Rhopilema esculentum TaxID=499914 RepID=UPI0031D48E0F
MAVNTVHVVGAKIAFLPTLLYNLIRSRIDRNWYDRIDHTIVLGALPFFSTARKLAEEEGVKGVISLNQEYELKYLSPTAIQWDDLGVKQLKIPTLDFDAAPSIQEIQKGIDFINYYREKNQSVYIHCKAGRGRSALLVTCYLIQTNGMSPDEAFSFIKSKRNHVLVWENQRKRIQEFAALMNG